MTPRDRKSIRLNSSHANIYTLSLHDALPILSSAREWDAGGRDQGELYRGARLAGALDWTALHDDELNALEREFIQSSLLEAERWARRQRSQNRRLRSLLLGGGLLPIVAV